MLDLHVARNFLSQSDSGPFKLKQVLVIIMWLDILKTNELIKRFCLVLVRHVQISLDQSNSTILETPITQEKLLDSCI